MLLQKQEFNGKVFTLYKGEKYFSRGCKRMHVYVWEITNKTKVPKGYHVHHLDENTFNNSPENLELIPASIHSSYHASKFHKENPEWAKAFYEKGIEAAKDWHKSKEGLEWHSAHAKKLMKNRCTKTYNCQQCGKEYSTKHLGGTLFCSNNCKSKNRRLSGIDNENRGCKKCGNTFVINKYALSKNCPSCASKNQYSRTI